MLGINRAKKRAGKRITSAHPVKKARRANVRSHPRSKIGHHQRHPDNGKQRCPGSSCRPNISRICIGERLRRGPHKLCHINFRRGQKANHHAGEYRGQQNIAPWILGFFGKRRDAVEADVRQHRNRRAPKQAAPSKCLWVIKRPCEEVRVAVRMTEDVANRGHKNNHHDRAHPCGQPGVHSRGSLDPAKVQKRKRHRKKNLPAPGGDGRSKFVRLPRAPDHANQWIHDVVHHHAPTRHIPDGRVDLLRHIRERRPRARVRSRHATIAPQRLLRCSCAPYSIV